MGTLFLLPNLLGDQKNWEVFLPASVGEAVENLHGLIAESERAGRRYLSLFLGQERARALPIAVWDPKEIDFLLEPLLQGETWGFVSDAGLPCIADPGWQLVRRARRRGLSIQTFPGPNALLSALMLSGLSGQSFAFHGYLPKEPKERERRLRLLERRSREERVVQMFMEAPFRNCHLFATLLASLRPETTLSIAVDLTMETEWVETKRIEAWKRNSPPELHKKPAVYSLLG